MKVETNKTIKPGVPYSKLNGGDVVRIEGEGDDLWVLHGGVQGPVGGALRVTDGTYRYIGDASLIPVEAKLVVQE